MVRLSCPCCAGTAVEARHTLFRSLMRGERLPAGFSWYGNDLPGVCPPKSLFVQLLMFATVGALVAGGLWLLGYFPLTRWLVVVPLLLLGSLLYDAFVTFGRYRAWGSEWVCGDCRQTVQAGTPDCREESQAAYTQRATQL